MKKPTFGICAPSSYVRQPDFDQGIEKLRALGHDLVLHPQAYGRLGDTQLAGTVDEKIAALYDLMDDPKVDMILTACGGQSQARLLDRLDFTKFSKPFMGYSDNSTLVNAIFAKNQRIQYHSPDVCWFRPKFFRQDLYEQIMGVLNGTAHDLPLDDVRVMRPGTGTGRLFGGNLSVFQYLLHTPWCPDLDGAILFFEDVTRELTSFDRVMNYFRLLGIFDRAAGVIFGQFSDMLDTGRPFGFTVDEIIATHTADAKCPIITNAPFGHTGLLVTYPVGAVVTLDARGAQPTLTIKK